MDLVTGLRARIDHVVGEADTAIALGSGDVPVLATPRVLAWIEQATVAALAGRLELSATSVGTRVALEHLAATGVGATVAITAELVAVEGIELRFAVAAHEGDRELARGEVTRVLVERERFLRPVTPR
jgi:predicted thioesterase